MEAQRKVLLVQTSTLEVEGDIGGLVGHSLHDGPGCVDEAALPVDHRSWTIAPKCQKNKTVWKLDPASTTASWHKACCAFVWESR